MPSTPSRGGSQRNHAGSLPPSGSELVSAAVVSDRAAPPVGLTPSNCQRRAGVKAMKLAVISDLHLGESGRTDAFGHDDGEFLRFLTFLERNFEQVVLLGDIWETLTGISPGRASLVLERARSTHREIASRFNNGKYVYVFGNHDIVCAEVDRAPERLSLHVDGVRLLFMHGHQNDMLIHEARWASELGVWLGGWIRRLGLVSLYRVCSRLEELRSGFGETPAEQTAFRSWALKLAEEQGADVIVTGHTHYAARVERDDRLYLNSGSCSEGQLSFLSLDTRRGDYTVHTTF